jgi:RecB family exonuclease
LENKNQIVFTQAMPDADTTITMGHGMLKVFYESIDLTGFEIFGVELRVKAPLYTCNGLTGYRIVGTIDLLLKNQAGEIIIVNYNNGSRAKTQAEVNTDLQMTIHSMLLASQRRIVLPSSPLKGRFDVLFGPQNPKLEHYHTVRTEDDRKRLSKIAFKVLTGIKAGVFFPNRGQLCSDCGYARTCEGWHR